MSTEIDEDENAEQTDIKDANGSPQIIAPLTPTTTLNLKDGEHSKRKLSVPEKSSSSKRKPRGSGAAAKTLMTKGKENAAHNSSESANENTKRLYKGKANKSGKLVEDKTTPGITQSINDVVLPETVETPRTKKSSASR